MNTQYTTQDKKAWITPIVEDLNIQLIKQTINQQDVEILNLLASDEKAFRLLTGSTG
jgi:hypothetical protein